MYRVFDERFKIRTIFQGNALECSVFLTEEYDEEHPDFEHVWMEKVEEQ